MTVLLYVHKPVQPSDGMQPVVWVCLRNGHGDVMILLLPCPSENFTCPAHVTTMYVVVCRAERRVVWEYSLAGGAF
jgi:hypothetical protein